MSEEHASTPPRRVPPRLAICRNCFHFVHPTEWHCPFCEESLIDAAVRYNEQLAKARKVAGDLEALLQQAGVSLDRIPGESFAESDGTDPSTPKGG